MLWVVVLAILAVSFGVAAVAIVNATSEGKPRPRVVTVGGAFVEVPQESTERMFLAGSGSNLPLTRALVDAFARRRGAVGKFVVFESIGSTGGVRAARDRAVDLGLISRSLREHEREYGLQVVPYARVAVVVATHPGVDQAGITRAQLVAMYRGEQVTWDDGSELVVLQRERGDSSHEVFGRRIPEFASADRAARDQRRFRIIYHDRAMQEALTVTTGALGLFDDGAIQSQNLPLRVLSIDGVAASVETVEDGSYPFVKQLSFVYTKESGGAPVVREFLRFVASDAGQAIVRAGGYVPLLPGTAEKL